MIIAFHNHKGGIGTTTLAAHLCVLAKELGIPVAGVSADFKKELPRFLEPEKIPCIELDPRRDEPDYDLFVIDVQSTTAPPIEPDVWIIPLCDRTSNENAAASPRAPCRRSAGLWPRVSSFHQFNVSVIIDYRVRLGSFACTIQETAERVRRTERVISPRRR
jgi:hypothetical protein